MTLKVGDVVKSRDHVWPYMKKGEVMYVSKSIVVVRCIESGGSALAGIDYSLCNEGHVSEKLLEPYEPPNKEEMR